jgi:hypothetical protein
MWLLHTSVKLAYTERLNNTGQDMAQPNKPSAFPDWTKDGMTLRDYFAAKAMQGFCASPTGMEWANSRLAAEAYDLADAMLKAREA